MAGKKKSPSKSSGKTFGSKRTANPPGPHPHGEQNRNATSGFSDEDAKRRLGDFEGAGEHARTGNRGHQ